MKKTGIAVLTGILLLATGCSALGTGYYADGVEALKKKDYYLAAASFEEAIREQERLPEAYRGAGIAYLRKKEYEKAEKAFADSLDALQGKNDNFCRDVLFYTIEVKEALNKKEEALEACDRLLEIKEETDAFFLKGRLYLSVGEREEARAYFEKAVKNNNDYNRYIDIFQAYAAYASRADGEEFLEMALEIEQKGIHDIYEKGRIYYYLYEYDNAKQYLTDAVNGGEEDALLLLGKVYLEQEEPENARVMYTNYLNEKAKSAKAYNGLVLCDLAEKKYEQALEHVSYGLACKDEGMTQELLFNEVIVYEYQRDYDAARAKMEEYLAKYPDDDTAVREYQFLQSRQVKENDENV